MHPALSAFLGGVFLVVGGLALLLMLRVYGTKVPTETRLKLVRMHRILGWSFLALYLVMAVVMVQKVVNYTSFKPLQALHITLGIGLLPILAVKILIVRRYPSLHRLLPALGITVYCLSVVLVVLGAGPFLIAKATAPDVEGLGEEQLVALGEQLLPQRCQKCHDLDRVYDLKGRRSAALWATTVDRMVELDPPLEDVRAPILAFLQTEFAAPEGPKGLMLSGAALVEARCSKCHSLDRVYGPTKTEEGWRATVRRYAELLPDHIRSDEIEPIVLFLFDKRGRKPDPEEQKRVVFEQHCGRCHNLSRALGTARETQISPRRWRRILKRMKGIAAERELGDVWSDEEGRVIADYLAAQYQEEETEKEK